LNGEKGSDNHGDLTDPLVDKETTTSHGAKAVGIETDENGTAGHEAPSDGGPGEPQKTPNEKNQRVSARANAETSEPDAEATPPKPDRRSRRQKRGGKRRRRAKAQKSKPQKPSAAKPKPPAPHDRSAAGLARWIKKHCQIAHCRDLAKSAPDVIFDADKAAVGRLNSSLKGCVAKCRK